MKNFSVAISVVLLGILLGGCSFNNKQAAEESSLKEQNSLLKENSSLKAKQRSKKSSSLNTENSFSENDGNDKSANSSSSNVQEDLTNLSDVEVAQRVKVALRDTAPEYSTLVTNNGDGTYDVEVRKDSPNGDVTTMIGIYTYNAEKGTITSKYETGSD
ncbi:hypothetical protein EFR40_05655 [Limosilactobacillus fermentum]|uniref:hypothetical protein n=2 Tax=Limosilactobacillus fermentum TaxID=1613 RepID=UPI0021823C93|nr:hypothetical protein [Limosilactobacillus fermentum]MCS8609562.1 hypothetical protein [Limosilactobacillus fermentum]MCT3464711.1 hypothetical protein [Limosilactobacillus fermentum]